MKRSGPGHRRAAHRSAARRSHAHGRRRPAEPGVAAPSPPESPRTRSPHARMPAAAAALPAPPSARARASRKSRTAPWRSVRPAPRLLRRPAGRSADTPLLWPLGVHVPACEKSACRAHTTWESVTCSGRGQEPTPTRWLRPGLGPPACARSPQRTPQRGKHVFAPRGHGVSATYTTDVTADGYAARASPGTGRVLSPIHGF